VAAHKEIQRILHKARGFSGRLRQARMAAVRKAVPERLHKRLGVSAPPKGRRHTAPAAGPPWRGFTPRSTGLTARDLRARARAERRDARPGDFGRASDAADRERGRVPGARQDGARAPQAPAQARANGNGHAPRQADILRQAGLRAPAPARASGQPPPARPARASAPPAPARPLLPHETVRAPDRPRWSGLRRRTA